MSFVRGIKLNDVDCSNYVVRDSMTVTYNRITGLEDVRTEDLVLHSDMIGWNRAFTFSMMVTNEEKAMSLLNILKQDSVKLTVTDPAAGEEEDIYCRPDVPSISMSVSRESGTYWRISDIVLTERDGTSV